MLVLVVCVPVPALAFSGLSVPLPSVVERVAAALVPFASAAPIEDGTTLASGRIVHSAKQEEQVLRSTSGATPAATLRVTRRTPTPRLPAAPRSVRPMIAAPPTSTSAGPGPAPSPEEATPTASTVSPPADSSTPAPAETTPPPAPEEKPKFDETRPTEPTPVRPHPVDDVDVMPEPEPDVKPSPPVEPIDPKPKPKPEPKPEPKPAPQPEPPGNPDPPRWDPRNDNPRETVGSVG